MDKACVDPIFRDKRRRVWELDFLRGVAVIAMCFDHLMFDLASFKSWFSNSRDISNAFLQTLNDFARAYWNTTGEYGFRFWAHYIFVFLFLFLVGTSCAFSRDNTKRGALLGAVSVVFTGATFVLREFGIMQDGVVFGILQCIAMSILCAAAVDVLTSFNKHVNKYAPLVLGVVIMSVGIGFKFWDIMFDYDKTFTNDHFLGYVLGAHAYGDDWFGLFPYVGMVLIGMYWGKAAYAVRVSLLPRLDGVWNKPINFVGRHALLFFLAHQLVLAGILGVVCLAVGYRF